RPASQRALWRRPSPVDQQLQRSVDGRRGEGEREHAVLGGTPAAGSAERRRARGQRQPEARVVGCAAEALEQLVDRRWAPARPVTHQPAIDSAHWVAVGVGAVAAHQQDVGWLPAGRGRLLALRMRNVLARFGDSLTQLVALLLGERLGLVSRLLELLLLLARGLLGLLS